MTATNDSIGAENKAGNSASTKPAKGRGRGPGNPDKIKPFQFKKGDERINRGGRPKGTTLKEQLRRQVNRIVLGADGQPNPDGIMRGDLLASEVMKRGIAGDMRAAEIAFRFDQERPNGILQGEIVPGTVVNVNAQANAQIIENKGRGSEDLVERVRAFYGLGPRQPRSVTAEPARAEG